MLWLILCYRQRLFVTLGCVVLLLCGCQPKTELAVTSQAPAELKFLSRVRLIMAVPIFIFSGAGTPNCCFILKRRWSFTRRHLICDEKAEVISEKVPILLLRLERTDQASIWLHNYLATHPDKTGMRMLYAKVLLRQKKNTEAMHQYQLISDQHPDDPAILLLLAEMYLAADQPDKAGPLIERVLSRDPSSYPGHVLMARLCQVQDRVDEAVGHYQKALERNWSSELQMELGELYIKIGRYDEAAALYGALIERDEQNESARVALIHVYLLQKKERPGPG